MKSHRELTKILRTINHNELTKYMKSTMQISVKGTNNYLRRARRMVHQKWQGPIAIILLGMLPPTKMMHFSMWFITVTRNLNIHMPIALRKATDLSLAQPQLKISKPMKIMCP